MAGPSEDAAGGDTAGTEASTGDPPQFVAVVCGGKRGTFQLADKTVECACSECDRPGMMPWNVTHWERHCGRGSTKKWRDSIYVADELGGGSLGKWLARSQGASSSSSSFDATASAEQAPADGPGRGSSRGGGGRESGRAGGRGRGGAGGRAGGKAGSRGRGRANPESASGAAGAVDSSEAPALEEALSEPESPLPTQEYPEEEEAQQEAPAEAPAPEPAAESAGKSSASAGQKRGGGSGRASGGAGGEAVGGKARGRGGGQGRGRAGAAPKGAAAPDADGGSSGAAGAEEAAEEAAGAGKAKRKDGDKASAEPRKKKQQRGEGSEAPAVEAKGEGPNAALVAYLASIKGREAAAAAFGRHFALQRCYGLVKKSRSPLNPDHIKLLKGFGEGLVTKRVVGHFAKKENRRELPPGMPPSPGEEKDKKGSGSASRKQRPPEYAGDMRAEVEATIDSALESGELGDRGKLTTSLKNGLKGIRDSLVVFLCLHDVRDLALLRTCSPDLLDFFKVTHKPARKKGGTANASRARSAAAAAAATSSEGRAERPAARGVSHKRRTSSAAAEVGSTPKPKRRRSASGIAEALKAPTFSLDSIGTAVISPPPANPEPALLTPEPKRKLRPCKPFSGGWAIMVGLHLAGRPLKKMELVELSAARGLCREPLVKLQRTVGRGGQWYDAWSSCSRLRRIGWVSRVGGFKYALTAAGQIEAARYGEECERVRGQSCAAGLLRSDLPQSPAAARVNPELNGKVKAETKEEPVDDETVGASLLATQAELGASQADWAASQPEPSASQLDFPASQADVPASQGGARRRIRQKRMEEDTEAVLGRAREEAEAGCWSVLVDTAEKPVIREALGKLLSEASELRLPGVDYAFGRKMADGEWALADVVVERKTVDDFHSTLTSRRAELQARIHASLRGAGFRVAMVLEGVQDLRQQPLLGELLKEAYTSRVDVLTTANLRDTAELLTGLVSAANEHQGWTVSALRALLHPIYEPDPVDVGRCALRALGVERPVAEAMVRGHGCLGRLLSRLPRPGGDLEAAVAKVAETSGLTLYQTGKAFRAIGVENAPLSRKRGLSRSSSSLQAPRERRRPGRRWRRGLLMRDADALVEVGPGLSSVFLGSLRVRLRVQENRSLPMGELRVCRGTKSYLYAVGSTATNLEPGKHWLVLPKDKDWRATTFFAARAYACRAATASLCASPEQAARHVAACAAALGKIDAPVSETRAAWGKRENGLAGVLSLVRTDVGNMGSFLPSEVAGSLSRRLKLMADCTSLAQLVQKLREEGDECLIKLGVPDFGEKRAAAIRMFLLGE